MLNFISKLKDIGIDISVLPSGELELIGEDEVLTDDLLFEIKQRKDDIILFLSNIHKKTNTINIRNVEKKEYYPVSSAQKRMFLTHQMDTHSILQNMPKSFSISNDITISEIECIFRDLISHHESLRTSFGIMNNSLVQFIYYKVSFEVEEFHIEFNELKQKKEEFIRPFNLTKAPLIRAVVFRVDNMQSFLMIDIHHIIADGVTDNILISDFFELFNKKVIKPLRIQYRDFSVWQNSSEYHKQVKIQEDYWIKRFINEPPILELPYDYSKNLHNSQKGANVYFTLDKADTALIRGVLQDAGITLFMGVLSIFNILLSKLSGQNDIVIGIPIITRDDINLEKIVGIFINTIAIRSHLKNEMTLADFIKQIKRDVKDAFENKDYQFEHLVEKVNSFSKTRNPIFNVMLNVLNQVEYKGNISDIINEYVHKKCIAPFDLTMTITEYEEKILINLEYGTDLFTSNTIERYISYFRQLVKQFSNLSLLISQIELFSEVEKNKILCEFTSTESFLNDNSSIYTLFDEKCKQYPNHIALILSDENITYQELKNLSDKLSEIILAKSKKKGGIIGIKLERSIEQVVSILAILKSGCVFVPIDHELPENRVSYIIKDTGMHLLITDELDSSINNNIENIIINKELNSDTVYRIKNNAHINQFAYIIYTSGTTGNPKGVIIKQCSIINLILSQSFEFEFSENERILQFSNLSFDASIEQILLAILNGLSLVLINKEVLFDPLQFKEYIIKNSISHLDTVPAYLNGVDIHGCKELKRLILGGEECNLDLAKKYYKEYSLYNLYGPTESTVTSLRYHVKEILDKQINVPIGNPIGNTNIYIIKNNHIAPIGVYGEICIAGEGLSAGYLNDPELSNKKFVKVFDKEILVYKTGDIARWLSDGNVEFLGRSDDQIKIRGQRIETKEIESVINKYSNVKSSIVLKQKINGVDRLTAYVQKIGKEIKLNGNSYFIYTVDQRPSIVNLIEQVHESAWPTFLNEDKFVKQYWKKLYREFKSFQFAILDSNGEILAAGNTIPIKWDGTNSDLPLGWGEGLKNGFEGDKTKANTLFVLAGIIDHKHRGKGLSYEIVKCMKDIANSYGLKEVLIPVRPTLKYKFPRLDIKDYVNKLNDNGEIYDPWIRVHKKLGGNVIGYCNKSQYIEGTVADWNHWTGKVFNKSGEYLIKDGHQHLKIDIENDKGEYYDNSVWITHKVTGSFDLEGIHDIKNFLKENIPSFMIPDYIIWINNIPLTRSGKIDKMALLDPEVNAEKQAIAFNHNEKLLASIWADVLGIPFEKIEHNKSFFELGGHSLSATFLIAKIQKIFGVTLKLKDVFDNKSIREQSKLISNINTEDYFTILNAESKEYYDVSSAQKSLYIAYKMNPESVRFNMAQVFQIHKNSKINEVENILRKLIKRHEALRTSFELIDEKPVQKIHSDVEFKIEFLDYTKRSKSNINDIKKELVRPFDLNTPPLIRGEVVKLKDDLSIIILDMHHIIYDGISQDILESEFKALSNGISLPKLKLQYKDYSEWQNSKEQIKKVESQEYFWLNVLSGKLPVLQLPTDFSRPLINKFEGASVKFSLGEEISKKLRNFSAQLDMTLYMLLLSGLKILFSRLSNQEDIIIGSALAGRRHNDLENIVGYFVNLLPIRSYPNKEKTVKTFLTEIKNTSLSAFENQDYQIENLTDKLSLERSAGSNTFFNTAFAGSIDESTKNEIQFKEGTSKHIEGDVKLDMVWNYVDNGKEILFTLEYSTNLFAPETIERMVKYYNLITAQICDDVDKKLSEIIILDKIDRQELLYSINNTTRDFSYNKTLIQIFENQTEKSKNKVAVTYKDSSISYMMLNEKANQLSHFLNQKGIKNNEFVGIMQNRSIDQIISILGVLKSGGAYLPIDSEYPMQRIQNILDDAQVSILLTDNNFNQNKSFKILQSNFNTYSEICKTSIRKQIQDLDSHPIPNRSLADYEKYNQHTGQASIKHCIALQCSRGCPYNCAYCHKIWPKGHIVRSAEHIFNEIMLYYDIGIKRFVIIDDIFNLNIKNSKRFFQLIIENNLKLQLHFPSGFRGDILTKDYIDLMVSAGVVNFSVALETASPRIQKMIRKNLNIERFRENIEYVTSNYPEVIIDFSTMHGFPSETKEEAIETLNFIKSIKWLHFPFVHILKIYPNTDMEKVALQNGISAEAIKRSTNLAFHELPETLPFENEFTLKYQSDFLNNYFLLKERLIKVLPYQMKVFTEDEILQRYFNYTAVKLNSFEEFLEYVNIDKHELGDCSFRKDEDFFVEGLNNKLMKLFHPVKSSNSELKILLIDVTLFYSDEGYISYESYEPPLGLMYISTYLTTKLGKQVECKIIKSRIDYDNNKELKKILDEFKPNVIGGRTLSFYSEFFHNTISLIRQWGYKIPIIAGGPYATSEYDALLQDTNIDLACLGEGEETFYEIIKGIINNNGSLPEKETLSKIEGIALRYDTVIQENPKLEIIRMDELEFGRFEKENLKISSGPNDIAYTIYTSGSSGKPKGVLVNNRNVVNLIQSQKEEFQINESEKICQFSSVCFDASVEQIWLAFFSSSNLVLVSKNTIVDTYEFSKYLQRNCITHLHAVPSFLEGIIDQKYYLKRVIAGGDVCRIGLADKFNRKCDFYNEYGPTETTVTSIEMLVNIKNDKYSSLPIGKPIGNTRVYILDKEYNPVPYGVIGDLYIGGEGVGIGYMNNVELTSKNFIENPFEKNQRIYRTGDRVRLSIEKNIEFCGREDNQIKIRGFRIELGEIENCILMHKLVERVVVIESDDELGEKYLTAYLVLRNVKLETILKEIKTILSQNVPQYMIPSGYIQVEEILLNQNGKVDRDLLASSMKNENDVVIRPIGRIEEMLLKLWAEILNMDPKNISTEVSFFELGGHSLKMSILISQISKNFDIKVSVQVFFTKPTIKELALFISVNSLSEKDFSKNNEIEEIRI